MLFSTIVVYEGSGTVKLCCAVSHALIIAPDRREKWRSRVQREGQAKT